MTGSEPWEDGGAQTSPSLSEITHLPRLSEPAPLVLPLVM